MDREIFLVMSARQLQHWRPDCNEVKRIEEDFHGFSTFLFFQTDIMRWNGFTQTLTGPQCQAPRLQDAWLQGKSNLTSSKRYQNEEHFINMFLILIFQSYKFQQQVAVKWAYMFEFAWISDCFEFAGAWHQSPRDQNPRCEGSGHQGARRASI